MTILCVTGTGPGVGTTVVTAAVAALATARGAPCAVVKPAETGLADGAPGDLDAVGRLSGVDDLHELVRYPDPLSPAAAARRGGRPPVDLAQLVDLLLRLDADRDLVLVDGIGGLLVRWDEDGLTLAALARTVRAPVLVVTAAGQLNATALTLEAMAHRGLELAGLVLGSWPAAPGLAERSGLRDLEMLTARPLAGVLPEGAGALDPAAFATVAGAGLGRALGGTFDPRAFRQVHDA